MLDHMEQFDRVKRYHGRFAQLNAGMEMTMPSENYIDDIYAFFQNCYHLKDWLKKDPTFTKRTPAEIEDYITHTPSLAICADICNATKHLGLSVAPRSGAEPRFGRREFHAHVGIAHPTTAVKASIDHNGTTFDAFTLATECVQAWEAFIL
jgi:hypothetical protein